MRLNLLSVVVILCLTGSVSAIASGLTNGNFESGALGPGPTSIALQAGSTNIKGWVVGEGGIAYVGGSWQASEGNNSLSLNLKRNGSISTTISTIPGTSYRLLFDMAGNPAGKPDEKKLRVWTDMSTRTSCLT